MTLELFSLSHPILRTIILLYLLAACQPSEAIPPDPTATAPATLTPTPLPTLTPTAVPTLPPTLTPPPSDTDLAINAMTTAETTGGPFYVSPTGDNSDGQSWDTAWTELNQIGWEQIQPGDTIWLDGGPDGLVYTSTLTLGQSGTADQPIRIAVSDEEGRHGRVTIFGGRETPLPHCGQMDYVPPTSNVLDGGIFANNQSWVIIDGRRWGGIHIHGFARAGVWLTPDSAHLTVRYAQIYDNGRTRDTDTAVTGWIPDEPGVRLAGANHTFERVIIHDNGQDAFQSLWDDNKIANFALRESWLYNSRAHPENAALAFNHCVHPDGIQIYDSGDEGVVSGITITSTIIGPGFMQGIILGQQATTPDRPAVIVNDVLLQDVVFSKATHNNVMGYPEVSSANWVMERLTIHSPQTMWQSVFLEGEGHTLQDSIIVGSRLHLPNGLASEANNCVWQVAGDRLPTAVVADPLFTAVAETDAFALDDNYELRPESPCHGRGSRLTSAAQLLSLTNPE